MSEGLSTSVTADVHQIQEELNALPFAADKANTAIARAYATLGIKSKEASVHVSNVAIVDSQGAPTRVGFRMEGDKKVRFAKTTGETING